MVGTINKQFEFWPNTGYVKFVFCITWRMLRQYLQISHDRLFLNPYQVIMHEHIPSRLKLRAHMFSAVAGASLESPTINRTFYLILTHTETFNIRIVNHL
jgi:hypothetical protein